jgi:prophage regulatory protein
MIREAAAAKLKKPDPVNARPTPTERLSDGDQLWRGPERPELMPRLYRRSQLPYVVNIGRTKIDAMISAGLFPKPVELTPGGRAKVWLESELVDWIRGRVAERDKGPKRGAK